MARLTSVLELGRNQFVLTELDGSVSVRATIVQIESPPVRAPRGARMTRLADAWVDLERGSIERRKRRAMLSWTERRLLACLIEHQGAAVTHRELIAAGWPRARPAVSHNLLGVYLHYLRRRLASVGLACVIKTVRGTGYMLDVEPRAAGRRLDD